MVQPAKFTVDPSDPRAPSEQLWQEMSNEERRAAVQALPSRVPIELMAPEGDRHRIAKGRALSSLDAFFKKTGRRVYLSSELAVYYPNEPRFVPDVLAVVDVDTHERDKWVVSDEGKGLDVVVEIHVAGDLKKDLETNRNRFARLEIPEYFLLDRSHARLYGWRLSEGKSGTYAPIIPQKGMLASAVLGLDLAMEGDKLRFYFGTAPLLEAEELVGRLELMVEELASRREAAEMLREQAEDQQKRAEDQQKHAEERQKRAEDRQKQAERQRDDALAKVAELEAKLARRR